MFKEKIIIEMKEVYNGMLKTYFYQFMELRPPKKKPEQ